MSNFIKLYESIINERLSKELARLDLVLVYNYGHGKLNIL